MIGSLNTIKFLPYYGNFVYNSQNFVRTNVRKLIPEGKYLQTFMDDLPEGTQALYARAALSFIRLGFPEQFKGHIVLNEGVGERAFTHLTWLTSEETMDIIADGMDLNLGKERDSWFVVAIGFLLSQWVPEKEIYKFSYFNQALFSPQRLLHSPDEDTSWRLLLRNDLFDVADSQQFNELRENYHQAKKLVELFYFRGGNSEFYSALQFRPFLPPISTYKLVSNWLVKPKSKQTQHITQLMIALYMEPKDIQFCIKALR